MDETLPQRDSINIVNDFRSKTNLIKFHFYKKWKYIIILRKSQNKLEKVYVGSTPPINNSKEKKKKDQNKKKANEFKKKNNIITIPNEFL